MTVDNCFESESFCQWWDQVEDLTGNFGWDTGHMLELLLELYTTGETPATAAKQARDDYEQGQAEAWDDGAMHRAYSY